MESSAPRRSPLVAPLSFLLMLTIFPGVWAQPAPDTLWTRRLSTGGAKSVAVTSDGGLLVLGWSQVTRLDGTGDSLWTRAYAVGTARSVLVAVDDGFFVAGYSPDTLKVVRGDSNGDTLWTRAIQVDSLNWLGRVALCADSGFAVVGSARNGGGWYGRTLLAKTDADCNLEWVRTFNAGWQYGSNGTSVVQTNDGGFLLTGTTNEVHISQAFVRKTDSAGNAQWTRLIGTYQSSPAEGRDAIQTADGGYVFTYDRGSSYLNAKLTRYNGAGGEQWTQTYSSSHGSSANAILQLPSGGFMLAGYGATESARDLWVIGTDSGGDSAWSFVNNDSVLAYNYAEAATLMPGGDIVVAGTVNWSYTFVARLSFDPDGARRQPPWVPDGLSLSVYPNPVNNVAMFSFSLPHAGQASLVLYDVLGRQVLAVADREYSLGMQRVPVSTDAVASGVYLAAIRFGSNKVVQKIVILK